MALHRENGKEQPFIPAGPFKIRIPFIHYRWEISECLQAILMCATCLGAIPVLQELLGSLRSRMEHGHHQRFLLQSPLPVR